MSRKKRGSDGLGFDVFAFTLRVILWGSLLLFGFGLLVTACEALGRGLRDAAGGGGAPDARAEKVTVAAARDPVSEIRGELYAQALDAAGYDVERRYGLEDPGALTGVLLEGDGAVVFPAQSSTGAADAPPVPGVTMLAPTREAVAGAHPAPVVGEEWARANPSAVGALDETTEKLEAREFAAMVDAVEDGMPVVGAVVEWRRGNGLPAAPGVRPAPEEEERRA